MTNRDAASQTGPIQFAIQGGFQAVITKLEAPWVNSRNSSERAFSEHQGTLTNLKAEEILNWGCSWFISGTLTNSTKSWLRIANSPVLVPFWCHSWHPGELYYVLREQVARYPSQHASYSQGQRLRSRGPLRTLPCMSYDVGANLP